MYLDYRNKNYWAIDIEGDLIPSTKIYCLTAENISTGEKFATSSVSALAEWVAERKSEGSKFIGHNIIGYDAPTLNRIAGTNLEITDLIDTMLMSMTYNPSLKGGHSLVVWGERLQSPKIDFDDFSKFTPEMLEYCRQDTALCKKIYIAIASRMQKLNFSERGLELQHKSWALIKKQQEDGFKFNRVEAEVLYATLRNEENDILTEILKYWPPSFEVVSSFKKPYKKDGSESANFQRHKQIYPEVRINGDGYDCYDWVTFNVGSPTQRIEKLLELGWVPREFTKKTDKGGGGNPKATDKGKLVPSLVEFVETSGRKEPRLIADWIEINSRANMINTWLQAYNEDTGCIHGTLWLANTMRYRHSDPNTANIPAVRATDNGPLLKRDGVYTYEARDLWTVRDPVKRSLVGVDAKGIQLRVLAHHLNNKSFTEAVLGGDPHSYNQKIGGFPEGPQGRSLAKTFIYAFLLGAGDEKVGEIIGDNAKAGKDLKQRFIGNFDGLADLLDSLERQIKRTGRIILCDGTPIIVDKPHTRLGYLLQGDESCLMKRAGIFTHEQIVQRNLDVIKVGDIHDEWQNDVLNEHVQPLVEEVFPSAFAKSGEYFNYRVPIECDSKVGKTWAETH